MAVVNILAWVIVGLLVGAFAVGVAIGTRVKDVSAVSS